MPDSGGSYYSGNVDHHSPGVYDTPLPIRFLAGWREVPFSLKVSSRGEPYWVEGNYLGGRGPEIYDGM